MLDLEVHEAIVRELRRFDTLLEVIQKMDGKIRIRPKLPTHYRKHQRLINRLDMAYQSLRDEIPQEQFYRVVSAHWPDAAGEVMEAIVWSNACSVDDNE